MVDMAEAAQSLYGDSEPAAETRISKSISPATALYGETVPDDTPASRNGRPTPPPSLYGEYRPTIIGADGEISTDAAGTLYEEPVETDHEAILSNFGFDTPYEIRKERESSLSNVFGYVESSVSEEVKQGIGSVIDEMTPEIPRTLREAAIQQYGMIANDLGMESSEVTGLINVARNEGKLASDPEVRTKWRKEAADWVRNQYGSKSHQVMSDAQKVVSRDPRLKAMLARTGLGDHPKFVAQFCERAVSMRNSGKLGRK